MILAVESSCDESALAVWDPASGRLREWLHSQVDLHQLYGGVVPDLASREHLRNFPVLLDAALESGDLRPGDVREIAVTCGPGLAGCLAIGMAFAKSLGVAWDVDVVGINHLRAHAFSPFIEPFREAVAGGGGFRWEAWLPHAGLLVSGGNTVLFVIDGDPRIKILGETVDDAAGEALDKGAKLLGLPYPGGPVIEKMAAQADGPGDYRFPTGRLDKDPARFSFSGLKTSLRYLLEDLSDEVLKRDLPAICRAYQDAVIEQLRVRARKLLDKAGLLGNIRSLGLSGGVANNRALRQAFSELGAELNTPVVCARPEHTGDNASMVAFAAAVDPAGRVERGLELEILPALRLEEGRGVSKRVEP